MTTDRKFAKELRFRSAIWTVALLVVLASVADAQATSADSPASADPSASLEPSAKTNGTVSSQEQHAPEDLWNRGTPRGAVSSFLDAARDGRWDDATALLDLSAMPDDERATRGSELAPKPKYLLEQGLWIE